jgi:RNA polymerase sigma-B factor
MQLTDTRGGRMSTTEPRMSIASDEVALLERYHRDGDLQARTMLIERMMPLVRHIARRYANRGEPLDDLVQVGAVGLIKAVDRFDLERGVKLSTFAARTSRARSSATSATAAGASASRATSRSSTRSSRRPTDRLTTKLSRSPTIAELAVAVKATEERSSTRCRARSPTPPVSFEEPIGENRTALELLGEEDPEFMTAERRVLLSNGMRVLAEREQEIMRLRFFEGLTQREIAEQVGISQMHVSRLIRRSLEDMRQQMADTDTVASPQRRLRAA